MLGLVATSKGLEDTAALEIKELINANPKIEESCVTFGLKDLSDLCLLCYKCQSADRVVCLVGNFEFEDFFGDIGKFIDKLDIGMWLEGSKSFKVECVRKGIHSFKSIDAERKVCELLLKKFKGKNIGFSIKDYGVVFLIYIVNNKAYFGIDFAGIELNKRAYKIFLHSNSLRGTIAYALVRDSGFRKNGIMLDPFSRDGVISIEAAIYASNFPINYYNKGKFAFLKLNIGVDFEKFFEKIDKKSKKAKIGIYSYDYMFKYVDYSRKNAKIAGVDKLINFSRVELEWLDIKFKKNGVDAIATSLPASKNANLDKIYKEFFIKANTYLKMAAELP